MVKGSQAAKDGERICKARPKLFGDMVGSSTCSPVYSHHAQPNVLGKRPIFRFFHVQRRLQVAG
jgi:hypothetical protein